MKYQIIENSEGAKWDIADVEYFSVIPGYVCGWEFEVANAEGKKSYHSVCYYEGTPEEFMATWRYGNPDGETNFFETCRWNGFEPTGRVVFRGYGRLYYDPEYRDEFVEDVTIDKNMVGQFCETGEAETYENGLTYKPFAAFAEVM